MELHNSDGFGDTGQTRPCGNKPTISITKHLVERMSERAPELPQTTFFLEDYLREEGSWFRHEYHPDEFYVVTPFGPEAELVFVVKRDDISIVIKTVLKKNREWKDRFDAQSPMTAHQVLQVEHPPRAGSGVTG